MDPGTRRVYRCDRRSRARRTPQARGSERRSCCRIQRAERTAILLGDSVYTLAWDPGKGRVLLRTWDPGLYFPEWPEDARSMKYVRTS
ncbi:hypothetical protein [Streptomyces ureilyticus]|uniref:hypothetical protein n=1 Tax=Streptomyces ureilyticus TaxID=1775131 RepID=UPI0038B5A549